MSAATTPAGERHQSIDAVRGFAVLGILLMNIVGMGLPSFAYLDPTYAGGAEGADLWTWAASNVLVDGKMRALFTMLFGASAVLIAERAARSEGGLGPAQTHYRRLFWLLLFGLAHAFLAWYGDVLTLYAVAGLLIFPFRKLPARMQIALGAAILLLLLTKNVWMSGQIEALRAAALAPGAAAETVQAWRETSMTISPPPEAKAAEIALFQGSFADAIQARANLLGLFYAFLFPTEMLPEAVGQMFVGMGLFRLGFFTLGWSGRAYGALIAFGYLVCVPVTAWLAWLIWKSGFDPLTLHEMQVWQQLTRPFIGLAHAAVLLLVVRAGVARGLVGRLADAGRMAFSNYLMSSVLTSLVFCGYGLGLFGELSRFQLLGVVAGVWAFMLGWSTPWLRRFHYGPFEWAWRSLVQWRLQPFTRRPAGAAAAAG